MNVVTSQNKLTLFLDIELNKLVKRLNKRILPSKTKNTIKVVKEPSSLPAPSDAPPWTISASAHRFVVVYG